VSQKQSQQVFVIILSNILQTYKKYFHWHSQWEICNKLIIKYRTTLTILPCIVVRTWKLAPSFRCA